MTQNVIVIRKFRIKAARQDRTTMKSLAGSVPRVARLMALAIRFDQLIRDGVASDQAEVARLGHVSRARLTQIMNLLNLAPDVQEAILDLSPASYGRDSISERHLRAIVAELNWRKQRLAWSKFESSVVGLPSGSVCVS